MSDPLQQFREALAGRGIVPPDELIADGQIHRCDVKDKKGKKGASYLLHLDGIPAGGFVNFADGLDWQSWRADVGRTLTPAEEAAQRAKIEAAQRERAEEEAKRHEEAQKICIIAWNKAKPCDGKNRHTYLLTKSVQAYGLRETADGRLLIPLRADGKLHSLQFIDADGNKRFKTGGRKHGCYFSIGKPNSVLCIAEGYATGASIHEATGYAVAIAFDAGNLKAVALALRAKFPDIRLILCADDDWMTENNPGLTKAKEAAQAVGGMVVAPDFGPARRDGDSDFNDMAARLGKEAVAACVNAALPLEKTSPHSFSGGTEGTGGAASNGKGCSGSLMISGGGTGGTGDYPGGACAYGSGRFEVSEQGVFFIGDDKDGNELSPRWVCSRLSVVAKTRDAKGNEWGRLLEWRDDDGNRHRWAMPLELLQGDGSDVRRELSRLGLSISPSKSARDWLSAYLQVWPVEARARCVDRLGWHGAVFVTPVQTIGETDEIVVFQNAHAIEPAFSTSGTADEWRDSVAALAAGNSRLMFALSVAFAGTLADVAGEDSGGFHLRGGSSSGKSTILRAAASVWGAPSAYPRLWRATANGLEGLAALHNDGLLILDELSQIDPREAGEAAYLLSNGQGKTRASRTGAARQAARWRLLFLSAGEESLAALMARAGRKANAGQEIRLADVESDAGAGMGAFEELHGQPTPAALALALKDAASRYHGAAGIEWLRFIVRDRSRLADFIADGVRQFVDGAVSEEMAGQAFRVARRFALVAVAGELATHYGLTGWPEGEADDATRKCFSAWLEGFGGAGNREARVMLDQVKLFFEAHGTSRFEDVTAAHEPRILNRAGFFRAGENGTREFLVLPESFKREICQGFDHKMAVAALVKAGWLAINEGGHATRKESLPGMGRVRCYVFTGRMWGHGDE